MRILVAGGAGYIGSHTCLALAAAGYIPITYDNLCTGHLHAVRYGPWRPGDILDTPALAAVLHEEKVEAVMHFAASSNVGASVTDPSQYYHNNVSGTLSLLQAMHAAGVGLLVFSSTCATFGDADVARLDEAQPQRPTSPYGASKWMCERIIADFAAAHGLRAAILRYFNAAGAHPGGDIGEEHEPETHLIPLALRAAARGHTFVVHGKDYPTADGTCVRDYVHVCDLAQGHLRALDFLQARHRSEVHAFHLGSGRGTSVRQVLACVQAVTGEPLHLAIGPRRAGDPPTLVADGRRACRLLGWKPEYPDLHDMVRSAFHWQQRQRLGAAGRLRVRAAPRPTAPPPPA